MMTLEKFEDAPISTSKRSFMPATLVTVPARSLKLEVLQ